MTPLGLLLLPATSLEFSSFNTAALWKKLFVYILIGVDRALTKSESEFKRK